MMSLFYNDKYTFSISSYQIYELIKMCDSTWYELD